MRIKNTFHILYTKVINSTLYRESVAKRIELRTNNMIMKCFPDQLMGSLLINAN